AGETHFLGVLDIVAPHAVDAVHRELQVAADHGDADDGGGGEYIAHGDDKYLLGLGCVYAVTVCHAMPRERLHACGNRQTEGPMLAQSREVAYAWRRMKLYNYFR